MKRLFIFTLVFVFILSMTFAKVEIPEPLQAFEEDGKAVVLSLTAAYLNKPKIELPGVEFYSGNGILPQKIVFFSSDASYYLDALENPRSSGLFGFFSSLTASLSPFSSKAIEALSERDFQKDEFVINGEITLDGGESLSLMTLLLGSSFSGISLTIKGELEISGAKSISSKFSIECLGGENRDMVIVFDNLELNGQTILFGPLMVSFKVFQ